MRLDTKDKRLAFRFVPPNATVIDDGYCIAYEYELSNGKLVAVGYTGTAGKPSFHTSFNTAERRREYINQWRQNVAGWEDRKNQRKLEQQTFEHTLKVGDILDSAWGYDQTNIDFYEVTEVKGKFVTLRKIRQNVKSEGPMHGTCTPRPGDFTDAEPIRKKVSLGNYINLTSYSGASLWNGTPDHWSSWA